MAFSRGNAGRAAISVETSSSYMRHLLLHSVCSKEKTHRYNLSFQLFPFSLTPHFPTGSSKGCMLAQASRIFPSQHLLFYFYILLNISKTSTKPTLQPVLEIGLMREPQGDGSTFQHGVTMDRGAGANQLDHGERRDARRQDKMCSKAMLLTPSLGSMRHKQELNVFCVYLYKHMYFR